MNYYRADVRKLKRQIEHEIPQAYCENWRDYGFALDVRLGERHCIACQPKREEIDQPEIMRSVAEVRQLLVLH